MQNSAAATAISVILSGAGTDRKETPRGGDQSRPSPNGNWIACIRSVICGMVLKRSASSRVQRTTAQLATCQPKGLAAHSQEAYLRNTLKSGALELEPFPWFLRLIR